MRLRTLLISLLVMVGISHVWAQTETVVFVSGNVRLEDGSPPPDAVTINRVCNGRMTLAAYTDSRGHFGFSVDNGKSDVSTADAGQPPANSRDLSQALNTSSTQYTNPITSALRNCEVQAVLSGFRTENVRLTMRDTADDGRLGTLILHPLSRSSALIVSTTTASAPPAATKAYDKALEALAKEKWDVAETELTKAVKIYPKYAIAWNQLGQVRLKRNKIPEAIEAWTEARQQDPKYIRPYENLATLADLQGDFVASASPASGYKSTPTTSPLPTSSTPSPTPG